MNSKQQSGAGLESFFHLEFYKKKKHWKLKPASKNNNKECKEAFAVKSDHLQITDDSKKLPQPRRRNHIYRSNNLDRDLISNPVPNNMPLISNQNFKSLSKPSRVQVMKVEQKPPEDSSGGFSETPVFVNRQYYQSDHEPHTNTLTPHRLGQNSDAFLEPLAMLPKNAAIDESLKECWWNCNNNRKEGLHADYVQDSLEEPHAPEDSMEEFYRGAHVAPHSTEEDLFRRSSDDEVDECRMTSRDLEAAARRHAEGLHRALRELLLRNEVARVSMIKRQCTAVDYPMQYSDCDLFPTADVTQSTADSPAQLILDVFVAGSYNVGHVAD